MYDSVVKDVRVRFRRVCVRLPDLPVAGIGLGKHPMAELAGPLSINNPDPSPSGNLPLVERLYLFREQRVSGTMWEDIDDLCRERRHRRDPRLGHACVGHGAVRTADARAVATANVDMVYG